MSSKQGAYTTKIPMVITMSENACQAYKFVYKDVVLDSNSIKINDKGYYYFETTELGMLDIYYKYYLSDSTKTLKSVAFDYEQYTGYAVNPQFSGCTYNTGAEYEYQNTLFDLFVTLIYGASGTETNRFVLIFYLTLPAGDTIDVYGYAETNTFNLRIGNNTYVIRDTSLAGFGCKDRMHTGSEY